MEAIKIAIYNIFLASTSGDVYCSVEQIIAFMRAKRYLLRLSKPPLADHVLGALVKAKSQFLVSETQEDSKLFSISYFKILKIIKGVRVTIKKLSASVFDFNNLMKQKEKIKREQAAINKILFSQNSTILNYSLHRLNKNCLQNLSEEEKRSLYKYLPERYRSPESLPEVFSDPFFLRDVNLYLEMLSKGDFDPAHRSHRQTLLTGQERALDTIFWSDKMVEDFNNSPTDK